MRGTGGSVGRVNRRWLHKTRCVQELLTAADVARVLRVSRSHAYAVMKREMVCVMIGRSRRVTRKTLESYLRNHEVKQWPDATPDYSGLDPLR